MAFSQVNSYMGGIRQRIARILFTTHEGQMVLLHGFVKKTQKTPQGALDMARERMKKVEMARRMRTSRVQLDRLLDPDNDSVTLATLRRAAAIVGREVRLELV
jgi:Phage derived protein Gp49-like (DUF891)